MLLEFADVDDPQARGVNLLRESTPATLRCLIVSLNVPGSGLKVHVILRSSERT
jgi:hypothetical protein